MRWLALLFAHWTGVVLFREAEIQGMHCMHVLPSYRTI
jgi:hypothetical protein